MSTPIKTSAQVTRPSARRESRATVSKLARSNRQLYPQLAPDGQGMLAAIQKSLGADGSPSNQGVHVGHVRRPFDFGRTAMLKMHNEHHSTCIEAKKAATVGLGHVDRNTKKKLDKLCRVSWLHTMMQISEDWESVGNGYLEVVREGFKANGKITGLHYQPACDVQIVIEDEHYNSHFEIKATGGLRNAIKFANYGDLDSFQARPAGQALEGKRMSELIHFAQPSSYSRYFGVPFWLAAIASIELVQSLKQHQFDFHQNRGVPEFMLFVMGTKVRAKDWAAIEESLQAQIGPGNSHKSLAMNLTDPNITVQLEKMAMEGSADGEFFAKMMETLSVNIVSAHRVPPPIAGILIPGKMGASNEASNAIMTFQALVIGQSQENFETTLRCTLGQDKSLAMPEDAFVFRTIVEEMAEAMEALAPVDTMGRMKEELPEAAANGRDLEDGVQKISKSAWDKETARKFLRSVFTLAEDPR
tara:strand:- start:20783 stop:22201 length:1419 start_codon:yes stop_codon:yes gene_type:complete